MKTNEQKIAALRALCLDRIVQAEKMQEIEERRYLSLPDDQRARLAREYYAEDRGEIHAFKRVLDFLDDNF
jgi:hypothetical protein